MASVDDGFPGDYEYAMAHRCTTCGAQPGTVCDAPVKAGRADKLARLHTARIDAGTRHRSRDIEKAPWPEDREPGKRYDTLD